MLTHLIPEPTTEAELADYERDIRAGGYRGRLIVADDLDRVTL